jgi:hypothetical protein
MMGAEGVAAMKSTWVTRRVNPTEPFTWKEPAHPVVGDLLLCEVVRTGMHGRVETALGARSKLYPGDTIVCAVGNRYATSMLEGVGEVGHDTADLLSASGLCGRVVSRCRGTNSPTRLRVIAQAFDGARPVNLTDYVIGPPGTAVSNPRWIVVAGSAMDSGKTTACASIIRGCVAMRVRVGAAKLTGTASARDFSSYRDAGAAPVVDFLDVGLPSTVGVSPTQLQELVGTLAGHVRAADVDVAVLEIADGLLQPETAVLLEKLSEWLGPCEIALTVNESLGALAGVERLRALGHEPVAIAGTITNSPLALREVEAACAVPCVPTAQLGRRLVGDTANVDDDVDEAEQSPETFEDALL